MPTTGRSVAHSRVMSCCCSQRQAPSRVNRDCPRCPAKRIDGKLFIIAGYGGADVNPAWVHNLRADPRARVELAGESFDVTARELPPDERQDIIPKVNALGSAFAEFQANTSRVIPIFELNEV